MFLGELRLQFSHTIGQLASTLRLTYTFQQADTTLELLLTSICLRLKLHVDETTRQYGCTASGCDPPESAAHAQP